MSRLGRVFGVAADGAVQVAVGVALFGLGVFAAAYWPSRHDHRPPSTVTVTRVQRDLNCSDFKSSFPTPPGDPNHLDGDHDGVACEANSR